MSSLTTSIKEKSSGSSAARKLKQEASVAKTAGKKSAPAAAKTAIHRRSSQRITFATIGGFKVFGSPVQPTHRTTLQIAEAVAELD